MPKNASSQELKTKFVRRKEASRGFKFLVESGRKVCAAPVLGGKRERDTMARRSSWIPGLPLLLICFLLKAQASFAQMNQTISLWVNATDQGRPMPSSLLGISFEEINHAGAGGLWAELVNNRGFEAGGPNTPSNIAPWSIIGNEKQVRLRTDRSSCFRLNPIALRMEILCDVCPQEGVGVHNPGFWGMDIVAGKQYNVVLWIRSKGAVNMSITFTSSDGSFTLAQTYVIIDSVVSQNWSKQELLLVANESDHHGRLALTSTDKGVIWIDQVSAMPLDTYKGHGFRKDLSLMLEDLKPRFIRFPGGSYVEGEWLRNAFHWRQSIGPWEERPGHFGDVWGYWTDDGLGYYEFLQLAEDLNAIPIWVFNNGISHIDEVSPSLIMPFIEDILHGIEFAKGPLNSTWGSMRAMMGHVEPFELNYVAIGNNDCYKQYYQVNYIKFYEAIKNAYPDIYVISNCDGSSKPLNHPADMYDFHVYTSASNLFAMAHQFDYTTRVGPKAFVSEYEVHGKDAGKGNLLAALAEGAFLIGVEHNSDVVEMVSYAPLFVNDNDRRFNPDAIVFNSWQHYGTPSYWVQHFFKESSGARLLPFSISGGDVSHIMVASALRGYDINNGSEFLLVKVVNFGQNALELQVVLDGLQNDGINPVSTMKIMTSETPMDENSFSQVDKVVPKTDKIYNAGTQIDIGLPAYSIIAVNFQLISESHQII